MEKKPLCALSVMCLRSRLQSRAEGHFFTLAAFGRGPESPFINHQLLFYAHALPSGAQASGSSRPSSALLSDAHIWHSVQNIDLNLCLTHSSLFLCSAALIGAL